MVSVLAGGSIHVVKTDVFHGRHAIFIDFGAEALPIA